MPSLTQDESQGNASEYCSDISAISNCVVSRNAAISEKCVKCEEGRMIDLIPWFPNVGRKASVFAPVAATTSVESMTGLCVLNW